ncbi:MAG: cupin domain-containing protein [Rhodospirillaceae bacterium]|nr:cupin domain-containing protein [Rhodospirillaceae bacterium]
MAVAQKTEFEGNPTITVFSGIGADLVLDPWPHEDIDHRGKVLFRDPKKRYSVGVWQCEPAKFTVPYAGTESCHVLAGRATLTNEATGESVTLEAGDHFFIGFGETITWEVHETFRKVYAMYEDEYDEERFY